MNDPGELSHGLRIAMLSNYLPSGSKIGVGYQVHALANALVDRGHTVTVFSACGPSPGARYATSHLLLPTRFKTFAFAWAARRIDLSTFDVLHAHGDDYWLWRRRTPVHIRTMHGSCFEEARRVPRLKEKVRMVILGITELLSTLVADRTALVSPQTRRWMPWVKAVIPNGVDVSTFAPNGTPKDPFPTILFVGTFRNRKRGALLMDIFARDIRPRLPDARLIMVCDDAPDAPGVSVTGRITDEALADLYHRAWVFCLPSTYEGFGIPYAEALMAELPVVASPNPGARYVLGDSGAGALVPDDALGLTILHLLTDEGARNAAARAAGQRAGAFALASVAAQYEALYRKPNSTRNMATQYGPTRGTENND